ncbi:restriction endonuclease subunit S [Segatella copri]|uniref:restriction endonuclease subunit S n=1 Tax=Segatella copri TaxID=165179 RepID=UPI001292A3A8|nr:restriction endonuclease subunit S [Segatella copri]MQN18043.1 hypothetical protein [Segatella copri]
MEYKTYKLSTCFSLIENGAIIKQRKEAKGFPITRIETLSHGKFNRDKLGHADIFDTTPYKRYILEDKDLIMSHINSRAFLGRTVLYRKKGNEQIIHGMNVLRIKTNEQFLDPVFASYLFKTSHFKKAIDSIRKDAINQSSINIFDICNIQISLPSITEQRKISHALQLIDKKIETNHLINDNLEAMAKQLYDYWFVQFDFPNEEGKPYKSNGGAMVWNEKLKREIPKGWSDCVLGDYIGRITNGLNPRKNFVLGSGNNYYVTIRSLVGTTIDWNNCDRCDDEALSKINSRSQLQIGDIIFSAIGTIGRTYYILEEPTNWNISETSFTLRAKENVPNDFFYGMLRSNEIQIKADKAAMGSTLRCLVMDSLCKLQYIEIPNYMMKLFGAKVSPLYRQIHRNNKEIAELTKQRDELLPLLMNGQATVNYHLSDN